MTSPEISRLLAAASGGDSAANEELLRHVYDELRRRARSHLRRAGGGLSISPTTLVHEAWIKFARAGSQLDGRAHFFNVVAKAMRQILCDLAIRNATEKHGGSMARTELIDRIEDDEKPLDELFAIDLALGALGKTDPELCTLVEWHYFVGLSVREIADIQAVSDRTVKRDLALARAFLVDALRGKT